MKFQHWFSHGVWEFANVSSITCNATLKAFELEYAKYKGEAWVNIGQRYNAPLNVLCRAQTSCILNNLSELQKAGLGTASVILGLLPTILALVSPSMSEMALLGVKRPVLAVLFALGVPAVVQFRVFSYEDPGEVVEPTEYEKDDVRAPFKLGPWSRKSASLLGVAGYVLALACIVNTISLAAQLSNDTILTWGCLRTWPLWVWVFVPLVVHGFAASGYALTLAGRREEASRQAVDTKSSVVDDSKGGVTVKSQPSATDKTPRERRGFGNLVLQEVLSCTSHMHRQASRRSRAKHPRKIQIGIMLNAFAGFLGFLHLLYGTVTFSGLLFIDSTDAVGNVAVRFLASAVIIRFLVMMELAGLRGANVKQD